MRMTESVKMSNTRENSQYYSLKKRHYFCSSSSSSLKLNSRMVIRINVFTKIKFCRHFVISMSMSFGLSRSEKMHAIDLNVRVHNHNHRSYKKCFKLFHKIFCLFRLRCKYWAICNKNGLLN